MAVSSLFIVGARESDVRAVAEVGQRLGLSVTVAEYEPTTVEAIERSHASVVMLDLSVLPGGGEVLCRQVARLPRPPLLLAIVGSPAQATEALQAATVCLTRPLTSGWRQLSSLLRLSKAPDGADQAEARVTVRGLKVDTARCEVSAQDRPIPLTPTEFRILACLARSPGQVVAGRDLVEEVLNLRLPEREAMDLLKVHVYRLRRKLAQSGIEPRVLRNVRGFGYMIERRAPAAKPAPVAVTGAEAGIAGRRSA
jgi:DNA-binding response OmpR family regulator